MFYFQLPKIIILRVEGADSRRYLNSRLSNDIKTLTPGQGCQAAALTPQGRTQALFNVYCCSDKEFILTCDGGDGAEVCAALKKYIVADRVTVKDETLVYSALHIIANGSLHSLNEELQISALPEAKFAHVSNGSEKRIIASQRSNWVGLDIILDRNALKQFLQTLKTNYAAQELAEHQQMLLLFKSGIPSFPGELNENHLFSSAGLTQAISYKKGCYVGQEVMEKVDAFGKLPKILKALKVPGRIDNENQPIYSNISPSKSVGNLISSCYDNTENITYCFAEVKNDEAILASDLSLGNQRVEFIGK